MWSKMFKICIVLIVERKTILFDRSCIASRFVQLIFVAFFIRCLIDDAMI